MDSPTMGSTAARPNWFKRLKSRKESGFPWKKVTFITNGRWKRLRHLPLSLLDRIAFQVLYALEAVVLVGACCLFVCCCGGCRL